MAGSITKAGRYQIVSELGRGSMGVVFQGFDPVIGRTVAIKTMLIDQLASSEFEEYKARFQREAQAAGVLSHPNIVTVYDFGEDNGVLFLAMEFLEGKSLQALVENHTVMPIETIIPLYEQICSALDHAHQNRIVHRDVKPANIMILDSGLVKVTDFGIAKVLSMGMTQAGQVLGTPNYMSPEQVKGRQIDGRSDIFSLGVILYELITGERPFGGQNITTVIYKIINENPISPRELDSTIHNGLCYVISKALAKDPEERYQTCRDLAEDLRNYRNLGGMAGPSATAVIKVSPLQANTESPAPPSYSRRPAAPAERAYPPPPAPPRTPPPVEAVFEPAAAEPEYAPEVYEEPQLEAPAPVPQARPAVRPARAAAPVAQPEAKGSPLPWIILAALLILVVAGGGYYFLQQSKQPATTDDSSTSPQATNPSASSAQNSPASAGAETARPNTEASNKPAETQPSPSATTTAPPPPAASPERSTPVAPSAPRLLVESNVRGAHITVDGQSDPGWVTPHTFSDLPAGKHEIFVTMDGYNPASQRVTLSGGRTVTAKLSLAEAAAAKPTPVQPPPPAEEDNATIIIETKPGAYDVQIDGKSAGSSPAKATIAPGDHTYTIRCPNGEVTKSFSITAGKLRSVTVACQE